MARFLQKINLKFQMVAAMNLVLNDMYISHHDWLQDWLRRRLVSSDVAADLTQDTFLSVLTRQTHANEPDIKEPRAYLTTIAKCIMANYYKRQSLELAYNEAILYLSTELTISCEDRLIMLETLQEIDRMLDRVPIKVRQAFLMLQLDGSSYSDIAKKLNVSERSVSRYIAQACEECLIFML